MTEWIGAAEAARRLGIKQASLYSYVSRGVLTRRRGTAGRASLFDASEVAGLARKGRPRRAPGTSELTVESELTEITADQLRYRGHDATRLAAESSFEDVAGLLWTGVLGGGPGAERWRARDQAAAAGRAAQAGLPPGTLPLERLQVIVPALAATDQFRLHLDPPAVIAAACALIGGMVGCLPVPGPGQEPRPAPGAEPGPVAGRLLSRLRPGPPEPRLERVLGAALVLLADHELAASTLAVRIAASVRADPYAVVATGLGALGGALHGGASLGAESMLGSAAGPADAPRVVGELLRRGERIPGLGHLIYQAGDPRAVLLLGLIRQAAPGSAALAVADAVLAETRARALPEANMDFALAVLAGVAGMIPGAGEAIFAIARTAGWVAHALEEYARRSPIRPRSVYIGPPALP
ncbi:MAG TPA: citrate/2-methylcitrate synthase [Streptosporangiaceae bacterium]|jgi:citrate synthase